MGTFKHAVHAVWIAPGTAPKATLHGTKRKAPKSNTVQTRGQPSLRINRETFSLENLWRIYGGRIPVRADFGLFGLHWKSQTSAPTQPISLVTIGN